MQYLKTIILLTSIFFTSQVVAQKSKLVAKGAVVTKVAEGFKFTEGPAVNEEGRVFFVDQPNDRIYVWDEHKGVSLWLEGTRRANGMYFNKQGQLVACADEKNQLVYFDKIKTPHVIHEGYDGKHLNAPNDLWIDPNGGIYFSDPYYHRAWWPEGHKELQEVRGVYYLAPSGEVIRVISDFKNPNGLIGTPDGKVLYVSDIKDGKTWKYKILPNGALSDKTLFANTGSDGMTIDHKGNIYLTNNVVWVYNNKGRLIEKIEFPEKPANVCFGGAERKTLFVTARTGVYTLQMKVKGVD